MGNGVRPVAGVRGTGRSGRISPACPGWRPGAGGVGPAVRAPGGGHGARAAGAGAGRRASAPGLGGQHGDAGEQVLVADGAAEPVGGTARGERLVEKVAHGVEVAGRLQRRTQPVQHAPQHQLGRGGAAGPGIDERAFETGARGAPAGGAQPLVVSVAAGSAPRSRRWQASRTSARKRPAISTTVSARGQASQMRSSRVPWWAEGRTSWYSMPASLMTPEPISSATAASYSAASR